MREGGNWCAQRGSFSCFKIVFVPEMPPPMLPPRGMAMVLNPGTGDRGL
jgi:hypothetical protein